MQWICLQVCVCNLFVFMYVISIYTHLCMCCAFIYAHVFNASIYVSLYFFVCVPLSLCLYIPHTAVTYIGNLLGLQDMATIVLLFLCMANCLSVRKSYCRRVVYVSFCMSVCPSVRPSGHAFFLVVMRGLSNCPVCPSVRQSVCPLAWQSFRPFVCLSVCLFDRWMLK